MPRPFRKKPFRIRAFRDLAAAYVNETRFVRVDRCGDCRCHPPNNIEIRQVNGETRITS
jgi:hypothetical protein